MRSRARRRFADALTLLVATGQVAATIAVIDADGWNTFGPTVILGLVTVAILVSRVLEPKTLPAGIRMRRPTEPLVIAKPDVTVKPESRNGDPEPVRDDGDTELAPPSQDLEEIIVSAAMDGPITGAPTSVARAEDQFDGSPRSRSSRRQARARLSRLAAELARAEEVTGSGRFESSVSESELPPSGTPFDLHDALREVLRWLTPRARRGHVKLAIRLGREVPAAMDGDKKALQQVVSHLMHHAIQHTEFGEVAVHVDVAWLADEQVTLDFAVTDNGSGVSPREQSRIMGVLARAEEESDASTDPLAHAAKLVRKLGGFVEMDSDLGEGTTFRFTVRLRRSEERVPAMRHEPMPGDAQIDDLSVLVYAADDDRRAALREAVEHWNHRPTAVREAEQIPVLLEAADALNQPFDVILFDAPEGTDLFNTATSIHKNWGPHAPGIVGISATAPRIPATGAAMSLTLVVPPNDLARLRKTLERTGAVAKRFRRHNIDEDGSALANFGAGPSSLEARPPSSERALRHAI